ARRCVSGRDTASAPACTWICGETGEEFRVKTALMTDPLYREHLLGVEHVERPERLDAVLQRLAADGLTERMTPVESRDATEDELLLCHTSQYLRTARRDGG